MLVALGFAVAGVWWVLPFAGIEVAILVYAFHHVAVGDSDFEYLEVREGSWSFEARRQGEATVAAGSTSWLRVEECRVRGRLVVGLRYAGRQYEVGSYLPEDQRASLARELVGVIRGAG